MINVGPVRPPIRSGYFPLTDAPHTSLLARWAALVHRAAWLVAIIAVLSAIAGGIFVVRNVGINTDTSEMLSRKLEFLRLSAEMKAAFPMLEENLVIVIDAPTPERAERAAARIAAGIRERSELFPSVYHPQADRFFRRNGLLLIPIDELELIVERIAAAQPFLGTVWRDRSIRGLADMMALAAEEIVEGTSGAAPAGLSHALDGMATIIAADAARVPGELSWLDLMFRDDDPRRSGRRQFLLAEIAFRFGDLQPAKRAIAALREIEAALPADIRAGVRVRLTGEPALSHEELEVVKSGMELAGATSFSLVVVLLLACFGSIRLAAAALLTLVVGLVWTAAFAVATVQVLNLISVAFAVLFIGLCVDFGIHFGLRYRESVRASVGSGGGAAIVAAAAGVGPGLALAALAAGVGFLSFLPTDYRGLAELGFIAGAGMAIGLFATLTLLPAFIVVLGVRPDPPANETTVAGGGLARFLERRAKPIVIAGAAVAVLGIVLGSAVRFDFDPLRLKNPDSESVSTLLELIEDGSAGAYALSHLAADPASAAAVASRLSALTVVEETRTLASFVPENQDEKREIIEEAAQLVAPSLLADPREPPNRAETLVALRGLKSALDRLAHEGKGEDAASAARLARTLGRLITADPGPERLDGLAARLLRNLPVAIDRLNTALDPEEVGSDSIPENLRARWIAADGRARVEIRPKEAVHRDRTALRRFVEGVRAQVPRVSGTPVTVMEAGSAVLRSFFEATVIAVVAIAVLLVVTLCSPRSVLIGFAPLVLAALMTMGVMVVLGLSFNLANVIVLPLLFGLGVANSIHLLSRERREGGAGRAIRSSTPRAVLFSALTTTASFASLGLSGHPGTASMGWLLTIAIVSLLVCSLTVLPALMLTWPARPPSS